MRRLSTSALVSASTRLHTPVISSERRRITADAKRDSSSVFSELSRADINDSRQYCWYSSASNLSRSECER